MKHNRGEGMPRYFAGVDVQISKGCAVYVIDQRKRWKDSLWIRHRIPEELKNYFLQLCHHRPEDIAIGVDAPRMPLKKLRNRYFHLRKGQWIERPKESIGRECEVLINAFRIGNCQWTNTFDHSPEWMKLGFEIFTRLEVFPHLFEVFPSASYRMFSVRPATVEINFRDFSGGMKDMLDAAVAALTVFEFMHGRGCEVGGEDGMGSIVLPVTLEEWNNRRKIHPEQ